MGIDFEHMNEMAIIHEPVFSLYEALVLKTEPELRKIVSYHAIRDTSGMSKEELIKVAMAELPDQKQMADVLTLISEDEWGLMQAALAHSTVVMAFADAEIPLFLLSIGYLYLFDYEDELIYVMPEEIKAPLNNLVKSGYSDEWVFITTLNKYALAAVALYGVISTDDFVALFNSQNERKTNSDEVCYLLLRFVAVNEGYCFWDEYIVSDSFEKNDFRDVKRVATAATQKARYFPQKDVLLRYADRSYSPQKVGRNELCPCGSGKKYKKCCGW